MEKGTGLEARRSGLNLKSFLLLLEQYVTSRKLSYLAVPSFHHLQEDDITCSLGFL